MHRHYQKSRHRTISQTAHSIFKAGKRIPTHLPPRIPFILNPLECELRGTWLSGNFHYQVLERNIGLPGRPCLCIQMPRLACLPLPGPNGARGNAIRKKSLHRDAIKPFPNRKRNILSECGILHSLVEFSDTH